MDARFTTAAIRDIDLYKGAAAAGGGGQMESLPPGFRFFPTDEELITCYLARKAMDASFTTAAIRDVDLYKSEPWDLPCEQQAVAAGGEDLQEGYFFCTRGSKYPSGVRARRATRLGYWKSTGKDKAVHSRAAGGRLVGTRKTLVFYRGRAPRGLKTGWVMHEYAMGDRSSSALLRGAQSEWVICKVFMRKQPIMNDSKLEMEEAVQHDRRSPGHHLPVEPYGGCDDDDGEHREAVPLPVATDTRHTNSHCSGAHAMNDGDHHRRHDHHMIHGDLLEMNVNYHGSSCASSTSWLNYDHQLLGAHCSALPAITRMEPGEADYYYLPELLDYDDGCNDLPNDGGDLDGCDDISSVIGPLHLDGLYWNFSS
ncbi:hypothetical protein U9M48_038847 [Paspalum notatum var. saurae]|uniref:NAC domain-containing protein n=1 Tax=Paspalum notatum var. saurae TaxID=547442 RepID=A0AAQ3UJE6_PASNO